MSGYSNTPLTKKLGIKQGQRIYLFNPPDNYLNLAEPLPEPIHWLSRLSGHLDMIHGFFIQRSILERQLARFQQRIKADGMIWVSWPKKTARVDTNITEDAIREVALPLGLVDIKVCAVDETWSGLKLVVRKELRQSRQN